MGKKKRAAEKIAMISSTAQDLPDHRRAVMDACLCSGVFPKMMEQLPASDKDAVTVSLRMVETSDIYIGVYGNRYGWIPKGYDKSIIELVDCSKSFYTNSDSLGLNMGLQMASRPRSAESICNKIYATLH
jgi:hypothetical protein